MDPLFQILKDHLSWHPSRLNCLHLMIYGILQSQSIQAQRIAAYFNGEAQLSSSVKRIERFWSKQFFCFKDIARLIIALLAHQGPFHLIIDRTNWKFGVTDVNYLVLALHVENFGAIPLIYKALPKKGNSNTDERIDLLAQFFEIFPNAEVASLTGDREFIGKKWTNFLMEHKVSFYLRIKSNRLVGHKGQTQAVGLSFDSVRVGESRKISRQIDGFELQIVGTRSKDGELVIIMTNADECPKKTLAFYKDRWKIETLFKNLKSKGFNLEETQITALDRLEKLMAVCSIAAVLCIRKGVEAHKKKPIPFRKTVQSFLYSFFQYGLNALRKLLGSIRHKMPAPPGNTENKSSADELIESVR